MTIFNQQGLVRGSYSDLERMHEGTSGGKQRSYANPQVAQVSTLTVGGIDATGIYQADFVAPDGTTISVAYGADVPPDDATAIAAGLRDALNGADAWRNIATATAVGGVVTINFIHPGAVYGLAATQTAPGGATLTGATPTAAGGQTLPIARWVVQRNEGVGEIPGCRLPDSGSLPDHFVGIIARNQVEAVNTLSPLVAAPEVLPAATMVGVHHEGRIWSIRNQGTVTAGTTTTRVVHVVIDTAGGQNFGESRSDADGGNTVALPLDRAKWLTITPPGELGDIFVRI